MQGAAVTSCTTSLVEFIRTLVGGSSSSGTSNETIKDTASQHSSRASDSNFNFSANDRPDAVMLQQSLKQQEQRQKEMLAILNSALNMMKTKNWATMKEAEREILVGVFAVMGGWFGKSRITAGMQVQVLVGGRWTEATVVNEGFGRKQASVLLKDDLTLTLQRVNHSEIRALKSAISKTGLTHQSLNLVDLCEAIAFLHCQQDQCQTGEVSSLIEPGEVVHPQPVE